MDKGAIFGSGCAVVIVIVSFLRRDRNGADAIAGECLDRKGSSVPMPVMPRMRSE